MRTGTLEHLDPHTLAIEANVRTLAATDKGFADSIREDGVLTPLLGWRDLDVCRPCAKSASGACGSVMV